MAIDKNKLSLSRLYSKARSLFLPTVASTARMMPGGQAIGAMQGAYRVVNQANPTRLMPQRYQQDLQQAKQFRQTVPLQQRVSSVFQDVKKNPINYSLYGQMASSKFKPFRYGGKAIEGTLEGLSANLIDIPAPVSQTNADRAAYVGGNLLGMFNPSSALSLSGKAVAKLPTVSKLQRPLGQAAGKLIAQGGAKRIAGKAVANLSQGIPYTVGYMGLKQAISPLTGQGYTKEDLAGDIGVDLAMGAVGAFPIFAGLSKVAKDKRIRTVLKNEFDVRDAVWSANNYSKLQPDLQMKTWMKLKTTADQVIPEVVNSKEMKRLAVQQPDEWLRTTSRFLEDALVQAKNPSMDIGLQTKGLKTLGDIQVKSQTKQGLPLLAQFDQLMSKGQTDEGLKVARQILGDPKYKDYHKAIGSVTKLDTPKPPTDPLEALRAEGWKVKDVAYGKETGGLFEKSLKNGDRLRIYKNPLGEYSLSYDKRFIDDGRRFRKGAVGYDTNYLDGKYQSIGEAKAALDNYLENIGVDVSKIAKNKKVDPVRAFFGDQAVIEKNISEKSPQVKPKISPISAQKQPTIDPLEALKVEAGKAKTGQDLAAAALKSVGQDPNDAYLSRQQLQSKYKIPEEKQLQNEIADISKRIENLSNNWNSTREGSVTKMMLDKLFGEYTAKVNRLQEISAQSQPKVDRTLLTGKQLDTPSDALTKGIVQPKVPAGKTLSGQVSQDYEKGLTSSSPNQAVAQTKVGLSKQIQQQPKVQLKPKVADSLGQKLEQSRTKQGRVVGANQSNLPSMDDIVRSSNLDVKNKVNIVDHWLRTPDQVLKKIGLGKESELIKSSYNAYLDELPKEIGKVTSWYERVGKSQEASKRIFKYLDGQDQKLSGEELKVAKEIKSYLSNWADRLGLPEDGRIASYITHIFEDDFIKKEFDPELAKIIQDKVPGSVYDPFLQQRLGQQGYVEDAFRALDAYVKRATRKVNMDPALEQLQSASERLDVDSWNYVKEYADRINLRPTDLDNLVDNFIKSTPVGYKAGQRPVARASRGIRQMVYRGTLGLNIGSAIRNLTQGTNTYAQLGEKYTGIGYLKAVQSLATRGDELEKVGVLRNSFIEDRSLSATKKFWENLDKGLFFFFEAAEKINRGAAYYGAKTKALDKGMSEEQAIKAGLEMARKTQFTFGSVDTPIKLQSDIVKLLTQFQSFNVKQTEFLVDMAKKKEYAGLVRWLGANAVILATVGQAMGWDWKDMVPFGGVLNGQSPIGSSPALTLAKDAITVATGGDDKYGNPMKPVQLATDLIPLIPGGVQINKTLSGLYDVNRGYSTSGYGAEKLLDAVTGNDRRVKYPISQTPRNYIQAGILGGSNLPEAKAYKRLETTPLGDNQTSAFKTILQTQGKEQADRFYQGLMNKRGKGEAVSGGETSSDLTVIESKFENTPELLTPQEIATYYSSKVEKPKSKSGYEQAIYEKEVWDQVSSINSRDSLTDAQKDEASLELLKSIGISPQDYQYHEIAKQVNDLKSMYVEEELTKMMASGMPKEDIYAWLVSQRKEVNGKVVLAPGVIDYLVDQNIISYYEGKQLKAIKVDAKTKKTTTKATKAKKVKVPALKKVPIKSIKYPKVKIVKSASGEFKAPKVKKIRINRFKGKRK